jgi:hypothetical protein
LLRSTALRAGPRGDDFQHGLPVVRRLVLEMKDFDDWALRERSWEALESGILADY